MHFGYVTLFVGDLAAVRAWYGECLGLAPSSETASFVMFDGDGASAIAFHQGAGVANPNRVQLHFEVADVDAVCAELQTRGVEPDAGPADQPWGYRVATLHDPAGHTVELYTPLKRSS